MKFSIVSINPIPAREKIMTTNEIAAAFTDLCKAGKFDEAGEQFWSDDIVSREPMGEMKEVKGRAGVEGKGAWWYANHEVHGAKVEGPYVSGDQFVVRFTMDITPKGGTRMTMDEVGVYTVKGDKVVEESFFYHG